MEKQLEMTILKATENFDRELLRLILTDLKNVKTAKSKFLAKINKGDHSDNSLLVA